ncbi:hypothetical protein [Kitasatospora sp. Root107]|uniref:hypothetical protein n=1 Tax=Kitasatospora sp. Root107 TaxID=1736424 RepID=UPI00070A76FC|nr:hypothetical protein [Kitasatospora sp. Root107]KQV13537.1 hypothetical protein ASC99_33575 [Kitasatospora sp. Root107]
MTQPADDQDGRLATALFEDLLSSQEPPVPAVLAAIRTRGRRLRRLHRTRALAAGTALIAAAALLLSNVGSGPGPTVLTPALNVPSATATGPDELEELYARLWAEVPAAMPPGLAGGIARNGGGPDQRTLFLHEPTSGVRLQVTGGQPLPPGQTPTSPCDPRLAAPATECLPRVLSDNSTGWFAAHTGPQPHVEALFATPAGTVFGLTATATPGTPGLTLPQLENVVGHTKVLMALRGIQEHLRSP